MPHARSTLKRMRKNKYHQEGRSIRQIGSLSCLAAVLCCHDDPFKSSIVWSPLLQTFYFNFFSLAAYVSRRTEIDKVVTYGLN
jgi:hypothetical protein